VLFDYYYYYLLNLIFLTCR